jgi:hypothetical protein
LIAKKLICCAGRQNKAGSSTSMRRAAEMAKAERSDNPPWSMICCYNAARNNPYKESHHPRYTPLVKVPDSAIRDAGLRRFSDSQADVAWLKAEEDKSARVLAKSGPGKPA